MKEIVKVIELWDKHLSLRYISTLIHLKCNRNKNKINFIYKNMDAENVF